MGKELSKEVYVVGNKQFYGSALKKKQALFNSEELYTKWKAWFDKHHYFLNEKKQSSKALPDGKEIKIEWQAERKVDEYVKFHVLIDCWILRCTDVIVEAEGKKQKMQKADFEIRFKGFFEKDYRGKWKNETLRRIYDRFIIKSRLEKMEGKIWYETNDLINLTKKYVQMISP